MLPPIVSHYKILEKVSEGGMGVVYKAQDTNLDRFVALKFLYPQVATSSEDKARFLQEAKAVASNTLAPLVMVTETPLALNLHGVVRVVMKSCNRLMSIRPSDD